MISFYTFSELKKKFGTLLSALYHNANIELDNISNMLVTSSFLDMFENNQFDDYMTMSINDIIKQLFPNVIIREGREDIGELYWSGIQYINIYLNYRIPLRTIVLLCPLKEMCRKYDVYHEMNEIELCKDFLQNEYKTVSILRFFRKKQGYSVRDLSILSDVPVSTIRSYEESNDNFYKASHDIMLSLQNALLIPHSICSRKTRFTPFTYSLLTNNDFVECIKEPVSNYLNKSINTIGVSFDSTKSATADATIYFDANASIVVDNKMFFLTDLLLNSLLSKATDIYLNKYLGTNLVF